MHRRTIYEYKHTHTYRYAFIREREKKIERKQFITSLYCFVDKLYKRQILSFFCHRIKKGKKKTYNALLFIVSLPDQLVFLQILSVHMVRLTMLTTLPVLLSSITLSVMLMPTIVSYRWTKLETEQYMRLRKSILSIRENKGFEIY